MSQAGDLLHGLFVVASIVIDDQNVSPDAIYRSAGDSAEDIGGFLRRNLPSRTRRASTRRRGALR